MDFIYKVEHNLKPLKYIIIGLYHLMLQNLVAVEELMNLQKIHTMIFIICYHLLLMTPLGQRE